VLCVYPVDRLNDGALTGRHGVGRRVGLSGRRLGQDRHRHTATAHAVLLFGHLIVAAVEVLLTLGEPLLEEGRVAASPRQRSGRQSRELALQLLLLDFLEFDLLLFGWLGGRRHHH